MAILPARHSLNSSLVLILGQPFTKPPDLSTLLIVTRKPYRLQSYCGPLSLEMPLWPLHLHHLLLC